MIVQLTESQMKRFEKLWFVYGNNGKKSTLFNHKLVQGFYESGENRINAYKDGNKNLVEKYGQKYADENGLTDECVAACQDILDNP